MPKIKTIKKIKTTLSLPADKSISHRAIIFSSLCEETTKIKPFLNSDDTMATLECLKKLGVKTSLKKDNSLIVTGCGMHFPKKSKVTLNARESGTTMRILSGLLSAQKFPSDFKASTLLSRRPMGRVVYPLRKMKADIEGSLKRNKQGKPEIYPPLEIRPVSGLIGKTHKLEIASAQVKSALLLAGLYAKGSTKIKEPCKSRDHTERMLKAFGANIKDGKFITLVPGRRLVSPEEIFIPSDFSSAAFFIVLSLILENSKITLKDINLNPTRCGLINVLKRMGANIRIENKRKQVEPYADITVKSSKLTATTVEPDEIPSMIDEVPILCVAASFAEGKTQIKGVRELQVKETDRVWSMLSNLHKAGVKIENRHYRQNDSQIMIDGARKYNGTDFDSFSDHRTAMSMVIFALAAETVSSIDDVKCIDKSFPDFIQTVKLLQKK